MRKRLTAWLIQEIEDFEHLRTRGILRFALRGSLTNVVIANAINISMHVALDRLGLLAYPLKPALVVAVPSATLITFFISLIFYSMLGRSILALAIQRDEFRRLSSRDQLSGLLNRRAFFEQFEAPGRSGLLVLLDIDHFKSINDGHGHPVGDEVIRRVGATLSALFETGSTMVGRIGGEEFALFVPSEGDLRAAEAARRTIETMQVPGLSRPVTVSLGVAVASPARGSVETYLAADRALYLAKAAGRNRVVHEHEIEAMLPSLQPVWADTPRLVATASLSA